MSVRIHLSKFLLRLGALIKSLPPAVMKPDDLVQFSRETYDTPESVDDWADDELINTELFPNEINILKVLPKKKGDLLLLGVGGGREAIPLAQMGFRVTGVDFVPSMVERAKQNAKKRGMRIEGIVQEVSSLDVPESSFDVVFISRALYSCVPSRQRRVEMLKRIFQSLKPGGTLICQFHGRLGWNNDGKAERIRKLIAASPIGNQSYQRGDILALDLEFLHIFSSEDEIRAELEDGGFFVSQVDMESLGNNCGAICVKDPYIEPPAS